jgi:FkbM family methyltransferase
MDDNTKMVGGVWVPKHESHLVGYLQSTANETGRGTYQIATLGAMMNYVPVDKRRCILDVGGHVGLWSMHLSRYFKKVIAFEPVPIMQLCFEKNMTHPGYKPATNVELRKYGLSNVEGKAVISFEQDNSGHTHIQPPDPDKQIPNADLIEVDLKRLDDEEFEFVDAIKIDVEGFEPAVLDGGEQTIRKHKPVICIEQKPHGFYGWEQFKAARMLTAWGAKPTQRIIDDYIFTWE